MDKGTTIQYLKDIVTLEKNKRTAGNMYNRLLIDEKKCVSGTGYVAEKHKLQIDWKKMFVTAFGIFWGLWLVVAILSTLISNDFIEMIIGISILYGGTIAYFVWKIGGAKRKQREDYEKDKKWVKETVESSKTRLPVIAQEKSKLLTTYNQCDAELKRLYAVGIVHPNYHSFVPCAMFLEYLSTGRTHSLEATPGDQGAYNLYEEELKFKKISDQLEAIRQNQELLCQEVRNINQTVNELYGSVKQIEQYSKQTEQNTRVSAWCDAVTAYNTSTIRRRMDDYYMYRR